MIRVKKSYPKGFDKEVNPQSEEVNRTLLADQHGKCYLCERVTVTDYEVEHRKSKREYEELERVWDNLLLSCRYCNSKKGNRYDDITDPLSTNVEEQLRQEIDFENKKVLFSAVDNTGDSEAEATITLLSELFNGKSGLRKTREERFFEYALSKLNVFQRVVLKYIKEPTDEHAKQVRLSLGIEEEFLGFKYWIIKSNPELESAFANDIIWNKER